MSRNGASSTLLARPGITGLDAAFADTNYTRRGNVTRTSQWLNTTNTTLDSFIRYDVAGNVVSNKDARGDVSTINYTDSFADGVNRNGFAFPTSTTSAIPDPSGAQGTNTPLTSSTVYDYSTGLPTATTDATFLTGTIAARLRQILSEIARDCRFRIIAMEVMPDHIHMLVEVPPKYAPAKVVQIFKSISSRQLRQEVLDIIRRYIWKEGTLWAVGYSEAETSATTFASTQGKLFV